MTEKPEATDETEPSEDNSKKIFEPSINPFIEGVEVGAKDIDQDDTPTTEATPGPRNETMTEKPEVTNEIEPANHVADEPAKPSEEVSKKAFDPSINPFIEGAEVGAEDEDDDDYTPIQKKSSGKFIFGIIAVIVIGVVAYIVIQQKTTDTDSTVTKEQTTDTTEVIVAPESTTPVEIVNETFEELPPEIVPTPESVQEEAIARLESTNVIATTPSDETVLEATNTIEEVTPVMTPEASGTDESEAETTSEPESEATTTESPANDEIVDNTTEPAVVAVENSDALKASSNVPEQDQEIIKEELIERPIPEEITTTAPKSAIVIDSIAKPIPVPETTDKATTEKAQGAQIEKFPDYVPSF